MVAGRLTHIAAVLQQMRNRPILAAPFLGEQVHTRLPLAPLLQRDRLLCAPPSPDAIAPPPPNDDASICCDTPRPRFFTLTLLAFPFFGYSITGVAMCADFLRTPAPRLR